MFDLRKIRFGKTATIIACALIVAFMLFSAFFIASEANHDCTGHDCPICVLIQQCENNLRQMGCGALALVSVIIPVVSIFIFAYFSICNLTQETLVSMKIRLND